MYLFDDSEIAYKVTENEPKAKVNVDALVFSNDCYSEQTGDLEAVIITFAFRILIEKLYPPGHFSLSI